jgi:hypothetical protein
MPARHEAPNQPFRAPVDGGPHQRVSQRQRVRDGADLKPPRGEIGWEGDRPVQKRGSTDVSRRGIPFYGSHRTVRYRAHSTFCTVQYSTVHTESPYSAHHPVLYTTTRTAQSCARQGGRVLLHSYPVSHQVDLAPLWPQSGVRSPFCAMLIILSTRTVLPYPTALIPR